MMKVSDPIIFGHGVRVLQKAFADYGEVFDSLGVDANNGVGDAYDGDLDPGKAAEIRGALILS